MEGILGFPAIKMTVIRQCICYLHQQHGGLGMKINMHEKPHRRLNARVS